MRRLIPAFAIVLAAFGSPAWAQAPRTVQPSVVFRGSVAGIERFSDDRLQFPGREVDNAWGRPNRTFVIDNTMDFARMWMMVKRPASLPEVDFTRSQVVFILSNASDVHITQGTRSTVDYTVERPTGWEQPYTVAVFPRAATERLGP